jgi:hypothetical protein
MHIRICRHIKTNGLQCRAAALADASLCYFHTRLHQRHAPYRQTDISRAYLHITPGQNIELCPLEDRESVQLALSTVINALATGQLDVKRATAILYGLQLASANTTRLYTEPLASLGVRNLQTAPEDSETPGLDLAQPGAIYDTDPPQVTFDDDDDDDDEDDEDEEEEEEEEEEDDDDEEEEDWEDEEDNEEANHEEELPETIPTIQATAESPSNRVPHVRRIAPTMRSLTPTAPEPHSHIKLH